MIIINVEDEKKSILELNGIAPFNEQMTFFYDESGNCRKFALTESGFNSTEALKGDFVLAGVAYEGNAYDVDVKGLYEVLEYKKGQKEIKFKHLYHNSTDFLNFIGSKRTVGFLDWLYNSGLYVHYNALNNLFYPLVDIVDSLWETSPQYIGYFWQIKNVLYDFTVEHQDEIIDIFIRYTYPDIKDVSSFCNELCELILAYNSEGSFQGYFLEIFRQMLKRAGKLGKMVFIQDNKPFVLIEEYYLLYLERCEIFSKSNHIFDEEQTVMKKFSDIQLCENGKNVKNWEFVKSHENILVQVSDVVAGLLRKLFTFFDENSIEEVEQIASQLNEKQIHSFSVLWKLLYKSDNKSHLFIKNSNTPKNVNERIKKLQVLGIGNKSGINRLNIR